MKTLLCFLSFCCIQITVGQTQNDIERSKKELDNRLIQQMEYILEQGADYTTDSIPFEVIKKRYLLAFKEHLQDSVAQYNQTMEQTEKALFSALKENEDSQKRISSLIVSNQELSSSLKTTSILGLKIDTQSFIWFFWMFFTTTILALFFLTKKLISSQRIQKNLQGEKEMAQEELHIFVKKSLSREQKLSRQILDLEKLLPSNTSKNKRESKRGSKK
jgi:hypothetical protein